MAFAAFAHGTPSHYNRSFTLPGTGTGGKGQMPPSACVTAFCGGRVAASKPEALGMAQPAKRDLSNIRVQTIPKARGLVVLHIFDVLLFA